LELDTAAPRQLIETHATLIGDLARETCEQTDRQTTTMAIMTTTRTTRTAAAATTTTTKRKLNNVNSKKPQKKKKKNTQATIQPVLLALFQNCVS
jgi:hypothetical protein